jgi:thiamine-monophosphate kinase
MIAPETPVGKIGERGLLRHLESRIPLGPGVVVGVGDDAAAVELGPLTLVTTDSLVENVHFRREWTPPRLLGRKALSVNLSDIAAMLGVPRHATVSLHLPAELTFGFVDGLYDGLLERAAENGVNIVGGNVSRCDIGIVVEVTLLGQAKRVVRRAGAVAGDLAVVTGTLGGAAEGLKLLGQGARLDEDGNLAELGVWMDAAAGALTACLRAQLDPRPPLVLARALSERELVHAAIDLSDGLSGDLFEMCRASGVSAVVDATAVPVDPNVSQLTRARGGDALALALHGGEDYQLLLAVPPSQLVELRELAGIWDLPITVLGHFQDGPGEVLLKSPGEVVPLVAASHDHFRGRPLSAAGEEGA